MSQPGLLGIHWLADASGCRTETLRDPQAIIDLLEALARAGGLTGLGEPLVRPNAAGLVGVLLLAESHASVHTDPASGGAYVDVFSCIELPENLADHVTTHLGATQVTTRWVPRGPR
ncbi:MAG: S-adenosylmethionine decarboxylase [Myxococcota bacterium]